MRIHNGYVDPEWIRGSTVDARIQSGFYLFSSFQYTYIHKHNHTIQLSIFILRGLFHFLHLLVYSEGVTSIFSKNMPEMEFTEIILAQDFVSS
jgi:hypothetical protein